jgi:hypothetical protein
MFLSVINLTFHLIFIQQSSEVDIIIILSYQRKIWDTKFTNLRKITGPIPTIAK